MKATIILWVTLVGFGLVAGCRHGYRFEPVERFPPGIQIDTLASASATEISPSAVQRSYPASFDRVWEAAVHVAHGLKRRSVLTETTISLDAERKTVEIRRESVDEEASADQVYRPGRLRRGGSRLLGWTDTLVLDVHPGPSDATTVTVSRTVFGIPRLRVCPGPLETCRDMYEPEVSNGRMENWILTEIEKEMKQ